MGMASWVPDPISYTDVTWTPTKTCSVTVNHRTIFVAAGVEITTPSVFKDVFENGYGAT